MVTLSELRNLTYAIMREEADTSAYPYSLVDMFLNSTQQDYCSWMMIDTLTGQVIKKQTLPFLNTDIFYKNIPPVYLDADLEAGDTVITVSGDASFYPDNGGTLFIAGDTIPYLARTGNTFTGCSNVLYPFQTGHQVSFAFTLPTNYMSPIQVIYNNRYKLPAMEYDKVFDSLRDIKEVNYWDSAYSSWDWYYDYNNTNLIKAPFYTIKDNQYLIIWNRSDEWMIHLRYEKKPSEMVGVNDLATIDNDIYAKTILPSFAAAEVLSFRWEDQRAKMIINESVIRRARASYDFYNNSMYEDINWTRPAASKSWRRYNI